MARLILGQHLIRCSSGFPFFYQVIPSVTSIGSERVQHGHSPVGVVGAKPNHLVAVSRNLDRSRDAMRCSLFLAFRFEYPHTLPPSPTRPPSHVESRHHQGFGRPDDGFLLFSFDFS